MIISLLLILIQPVRSDSINHVKNILILGNSLTFYNEGIDYHLDHIVKNADSSMRIKIKSFSSPGYTLRLHYENHQFTRLLHEYQFDVVIVQGQSEEPIRSTPEFIQYAGLIHEKTLQHGANLMLFMTWGYAEKDSMSHIIKEIYKEVGELLDVIVIPVGESWQHARETHPNLPLYDEDGVHPSLYGTYLSAWVFYYCIIGNVEPNQIYTAGLPDHEARALRNLAYKVVFNP